MARIRPRLIGLLGLALAAMSLGGCDGQPEGPPRVVVIGGKPDVVDPSAKPIDAADAELLQSVAQGLVAFDANGEIVSGLAERWNVSNDGLSYIFRISPGEWTGGPKITAEQVARALRRQIRSGSVNPLRDALGPVSEIVAMTDRVVEIRLQAPRPHLLSLLAQPELTILRNGAGTGPFRIAETAPDGADRRLVRALRLNDDDETREEEVLLSGRDAEQAVKEFIAGETDLVLGGTFANLPLARRVTKPRDALRFDPASGLFGLAPGKRDGRFSGVKWRQLLNQAIDRQAFVTALGVPGLAPRATLLEGGLDGTPQPSAPRWSLTPPAERQAALVAAARGLLNGDIGEPATITVALPEGPGGDLLLASLQRDWTPLGLTVARAERASAADFVLIDEVAPSSNPSWFARRFRCSGAHSCNPEVDELLNAARLSPVPAQRYALVGQASALIDEEALFMPIAAPVRWSLVGPRITSFFGNRFARHTLVGLLDEPARRSE